LYDKPCKYVSDSALKILLVDQLPDPERRMSEGQRAALLDDLQHAFGIALPKRPATGARTNA
jgi:hypothetical protein